MKPQLEVLEPRIAPAGLFLVDITPDQAVENEEILYRLEGRHKVPAVGQPAVLAKPLTFQHGVVERDPPVPPPPGRLKLKRTGSETSSLHPDFEPQSGEPAKANPLEYRLPATEGGL